MSAPRAADVGMIIGFTNKTAAYMATDKTKFVVLLQSLGKTCMYCGDGINDLSALGAADVGMAIGSTDASAAAAISCKQASIGGQFLFNQNQSMQSEVTACHANVGSRWR